MTTVVVESSSRFALATMVVVARHRRQVPMVSTMVVVGNFRRRRVSKAVALPVSVLVQLWSPRHRWVVEGMGKGIHKVSLVRTFVAIVLIMQVIGGL